MCGMTADFFFYYWKMHTVCFRVQMSDWADRHTCYGDEDPRDLIFLLVIFIKLHFSLQLSSSSSSCCSVVIHLPAVRAGTESLQTTDATCCLLLQTQENTLCNLTCSISNGYVLWHFLEEADPVWELYLEVMQMISAAKFGVNKMKGSLV